VPGLYHESFLQPPSICTLVFRQDIATWIDCHIRAFEFFGAVPGSVVLDNIKAGVVKPDIYDPTLNRAMRSWRGIMALWLIRLRLPVPSSRAR